MTIAVLSAASHFHRGRRRGNRPRDEPRPQPRPKPRPFTREELRRHGLPADWNERIRTGAAEIRGVPYGRRG